MADNDKVSVPLTATARLELTSLAYRKWAECYDDLKAVKAEKDDGSEDWQLFHEYRLKTATAEEAKYASILEELKPYHPLKGVV